MDDMVFSSLASRLSHSAGTPLYPKGDGRIEIPQGIVRLMGWKDKSVVSISMGEGCIFLADGDNVHVSNLLGRVVVSMERVRIPMSMLRRIDGGSRSPVVVSPNLRSSVLVVLPDVAGRKHKIEAVLKDMGAGPCSRLLSLLMGQQPESQEEEGPAHPVEPAAPDAPAGPRLFLPDFAAPDVVRIVGSPFSFQSHWVPMDKGGAIVPHVDFGCVCRGTKAPERLYLIPVIRRKNKLETGYLLVRDDLRAKIGRVLAGSNPTSFDLIFCYKPFVDGMFEVYKNPPEPLPPDVVEKAQEDCGDPNKFVAGTFAAASEGAGQPCRMPTPLSPAHFADNARPRNFGK